MVIALLVGRVGRIVVDVGRYLGIAVASLIGVLSIQRILLAGSVVCLGQDLVDVIRREMVSRSLGVVARETEIGLSSMGPDIVILGASALILTRESGLFASLVG